MLPLDTATKGGRQLLAQVCINILSRVLTYQYRSVAAETVVCDWFI